MVRGTVTGSPPESLVWCALESGVGVGGRRGGLVVRGPPWISMYKTTQPKGQRSILLEWVLWFEEEYCGNMTM